MKFAEYVWSESSSLSTVNLEKKIYYSSRDIDFFLGGYFFMARPVGGDFCPRWNIGLNPVKQWSGALAREHISKMFKHN